MSESQTPEGAMVMVPVEPSREMIEAGERAAWDGDNSMPAISAMRKAWSAMIAATQPVPISGEGAETTLLSAAKKVMEGLLERIDTAPENAVPVFDGIVDLHDAIHRYAPPVPSISDQGSSLRDTQAAPSFRSRVLPWLMECFGAEIASNIEERCDRFIEEALEQVQSLDWPKERAHALVEYVYGRPVGVPHQEAGGVMVTFAALCQAAGLDMQAAGDDELARIMRPEIVLKIRAKQAAKPTGSALPIATTASASGDEARRSETKSVSGEGGQ